MSQLEGILNTLRIPVSQELSGRPAAPEGVADTRLAAQLVCRSLGEDSWGAMSFGTAEALEPFTALASREAGMQVPAGDRVALSDAAGS